MCSIKINMDPFAELLEIFFQSVLPTLPQWKEIEDTLSPEQYNEFKSSLISYLISDYNCRQLIKIINVELYKEPSSFPSIFVEFYSTNETLQWGWRQWVSKKWPHLENIQPTNLPICEKIAKEIIDNSSSKLKIENIIFKEKWKVVAFQLNPKEMLETCVKYLLSTSASNNFQNTPDNMGKWKVEIAMKSSDEKVEPDSRVLLSQSILRLCKLLNYVENGKSCLSFLQIPEQISSVPSEIIVSFLRSKDEQIFMELNSKEFYSQYSETVVVLYNYARIKSILEKYFGHVKNKEYPELPPIDEIDFSLIGECKDEYPIILMLFMWPRVRENVINVHRRGKGFDKINLPFLFDFIKGLARAFDSFYNRNVIIVPQSAPHNFKAMFARLYLIKTIQVVLKEFIYISGIEMD